MNEDLFKIQKQDVTFSDTYESDNICYGMCDGCGQPDVDVDNHFCIDSVDSNDIDSQKFITTLEDFKKTLEDKVHYNDGQIEYIKSLFKTLHIKYRNNKFYKSVYNDSIKNKYLTKKQNDYFFYLLKHGRPMYEDNKLTTKN